MFAYRFTNKLFITILLATFVFSPVASYAATTTYTPRTQLEMIAYLQGVIAQLQAQLAAQKTGTDVVAPVRVYPNPYSVVAVSQAPYSIGRTVVTFRGDVDRGSSPTAEAWFEYGTGSKLTLRTDTVTITKARRHTITIAKDRLTPGVTYRYRLVIEDERGNRQYGQVMSLTTVREAETQSFTGRPVVETEGAELITSNSADLGGFVAMNDYSDGYVFLVYGKDRSILNDIVDDYDSYAEIPALTDTFKREVKKGFSGRDRVVTRVSRLQLATRYYYRMCVEFGTAGKGFKCGATESFTTFN